MRVGVTFVGIAVIRSVSELNDLNQNHKDRREFTHGGFHLRGASWSIDCHHFKRELRRMYSENGSRCEVLDESGVM